MDGRPRTDDRDRDSRGIGDPLLARRLLAPGAARGYRCGDARLSLVNVVGDDVRASLGSEALGLGGP